MVAIFNLQKATELFCPGASTAPKYEISWKSYEISKIGSPFCDHHFELKKSDYAIVFSYLYWDWLWNSIKIGRNNEK